TEHVAEHQDEDDWLDGREDQQLRHAPVGDQVASGDGEGIVCRAGQTAGAATDLDGGEVDRCRAHATPAFARSEAWGVGLDSAWRPVSARKTSSRLGSRTVSDDGVMPLASSARSTSIRTRGPSWDETRTVAPSGS